jgi:hypothetical protein
MGQNLLNWADAPENSPDNGPAPEKQTRIAKKIDECFQNLVPRSELVEIKIIQYFCKYIRWETVIIDLAQ